MQPYIHQFGWISDYYNTVYRYYSTSHLPSYPITYYSIDFKNSVTDKEILNAGSYEKYGVGNLSGIVWKRILLLPVQNIEQIQATYDSGEKGLTTKESMSSQIVIPSTYGLKPSPWDIVYFNNDFMDDKSITNTPMFIVSNVSNSTMGEVMSYQLNVKVAPFSRDQIEKQISSYYMFLEFTKKIHEVNTARMLLRLESKSEELVTNLNNLYNHNIGFYLQS